MIVDVHVHVFPRFNGIAGGLPTSSLKYGKVKIGNRVIRFFPPSFENSDSPVERYMEYMDWCGIDRAVITQNVFYGYYNDYVNDVCKKWPDRFIGTAVVNIVEGKKAAEELEQIFRKTVLKGLKIEVPSQFSCTDDKRLDNSSYFPIWEVCQSFGYPVIFHLLPGKRAAEEVFNISRRYPELKILIAHLGSLGYDGWEDQITLAKEKNIYLDTSLIPIYYREEGYPYPSGKKILKDIVNKVGIDKLMWATDYPGILIYSSYKDCLQWVKKECNFLTDDDKSKLLGFNAIKFFSM